MVIAYTYVYLWLSVISVEKYINMKYAAFISVDDHRSFHPSHIYEWTNGSIMHIYCKSILGRQQVSGRQGNMSPPPLFRRWKDYLSLPLTLFSRRHMPDVIAYTIWLIQGNQLKMVQTDISWIKIVRNALHYTADHLASIFPGPLKPRITHNAASRFVLEVYLNKVLCPPPLSRGCWRPLEHSWWICISWYKYPCKRVTSLTLHIQSKYAGPISW